MTIQKLSARLAPHWHTEGVTQSVEEFDSIERALGVTLPADYKYFMMELGAGEARLAGGYLRLYPLRELPLRREEALPTVVTFGSDGGDQGFGFDASTRLDTATYRVVEFPISALEPEEVEVVADSFEQFLSGLLG